MRGVEGSDPRLNGRVFLVKDGRPEHPEGSKLACERVYYAGGRGLCMALGASGVDYEATIFDSSFRPVHEFALTGLPSRARVSSDGRYGAMTVFVAATPIWARAAASRPRPRSSTCAAGSSSASSSSST